MEFISDIYSLNAQNSFSAHKTAFWLLIWFSGLYFSL